MSLAHPIFGFQRYRFHLYHLAQNHPEYSDAADQALAWYRHALKADWTTPTDVKQDFRNASILKDGRVVFNITGNKYRLVAWINYEYKVVYIRFIGTHYQYDKINLMPEVNTMDVKPIKTDADYRATLKEIETLMMAEPDSPEGDKLDVMVTLIEAYEARHFPLDLPDPVEAIKFEMKRKGLTIKDLEPMIGKSNRVYEILNHKRSLKWSSKKVHHVKPLLPHLPFQIQSGSDSSDMNEVWCCYKT